MHLTRRELMFAGLGSLVLGACSGRAASAPRDALAPTHEIPDDEVPPEAACVVTADNIEGPFYKPGAPHRARLVSDRDPGERLVLAGSVRSTSCEPIAGAVLDVWQADARGGYDHDGWGLRGRLVTDDRGHWQVHTILPGRYLNGRRYRPAHVHVKLRAPGYRDLTTQLYFEDDPYNAGDPFIVSSLVMPHRKLAGVRRAGYDFVLAR
jgi:protocatechuate 3,4-dioxygenase beta subunit